MTRRYVPSSAQVRMWRATPHNDEEPASETAKPQPAKSKGYGLEGDMPVLHGYTVSSVSRIVGTAVRAAARRGTRDLDERRSAALCAVVEELHRYDCDPGASVLLRAAEQAIDADVDRWWANWGYNSSTKELQKGFPRYWRPGVGTPLDEYVTERLAIPRIVEALTDRQREVLAAVIETGDRRAAARLLGVDATTVSGVLGNARRAFAALWHEGETPRSVDFRAGRRNPYSEQAAAERPEIARRAVRVREQRRAAAREGAAA